MNYPCGDGKGNLGMTDSEKCFGRCELQISDPNVLKRLSRVQNCTSCQSAQFPIATATTLRLGRAARHDCDRRERVDWLAALIERGPFDASNPLRF
jgi:hypothetical protein